jgi:hypothetical protein
MPHKRSKQKIIERMDKQRARKDINREEILNLKRNDGTGIKDPVPFIAVLNIITKGRYLKLGRGFTIRR